MSDTGQSQIWNSDIVTRVPEQKKSFIYNWKFWVGLALAIFLIVWIIVTFVYRPKSSTSTKDVSTRNISDRERRRQRRRVYYEDSDDDYSDEEEYIRSTRQPIPVPVPVPVPKVQPLSIQDVVVEPRPRFQDIHLRQEPTRSIIDTCDDIPGPTRPSRNIDFTPDIPNYANHTGRQQERWKREGECRRILETIYGMPFPKAHPDWLVNDITGHKLELDGYCQPLELAFEHMGKQHYDPDDNYNKSDEEYKAMIYRDNLKARLCKERGVYLYVIPYNIPFQDLENFIRHNAPEVVAAREAREKQLAAGINPDALSHFQQLGPQPIDPSSRTRGQRPARAIQVPENVWRQ